MTRFRRFLGGIRALWQRTEVDRDLDDELRAYLEAAVDAKVAAGMSREEAWRAAQRDLGNAALVKDRVRDASWETAIEDIARDVRIAWRGLARTPGFVITAVVTLALGIGANTAIFSLMNGLLLRPVPGATIDRVVAISRTDPRRPFGGNVFSLTADERRTIEQAQVSGIAALFGSNPLRGALASAGQVEPVMGELVAGPYFDALGVRPVAGRLLTPDDDVDTAVAIPLVISERLFRSWFQSSPSAIGTPATLAGQSLVIVGVAPESFGGTWLPTMIRADVWLPAAVEHRVVTVQGGRDPQSQPRRTFAWLTPDASVPEVGAAIATIGRAMSPDEAADTRLGVLPAERAILFDEFARGGLILGGALVALSLLVFLIACANLTNLTLARATSRAGEVAIRLALGGGRARVARLLFVEVCLVTAFAGLIGLGVAFALTTGMTLIPLPTLENMTIRFDPTPDLTVFGYAFVVAVGAAFVVGLAPAWRVTRTDPMRTLAAGGIGASTVRGRRMRGAIVAAQVAMSTILLVIAGLYIRSSVEAARFDTGYDTSRGAMASVDLRLHGIDEVRGKQIRLRMQELVRQIPGVDRVVLASGLPPFSSTQLTNGLGAEDTPAESRLRFGSYTHVSPEFFDTLRIPIRSGREFSEMDIEGAPHVAIVNEALAERFWPAGNAIGQRLRLDPEGPWHEVIGIAANVTMSTNMANARRVYTESLVYVPVAQRGDARRMTVIVTSAMPEAMVEPLRRAIRSIDPELAVLDAKTLGEGVDFLVSPFRVAALVIGVLGVIGFGIAVLGIYGVQTFVISQRTREIGIRRALGATTTNIYAAVIRSGLGMAAVGAVIGLGASLAAARFLRYFIFGIGPYDVPTFLVVIVGLTTTAAVASGLAARRAAAVDPNVALRNL